MSLSDLILLDVSIWELDLNHPDNQGKYRLAITLRNVGSVTFGPFFKKKEDAEQYLSQLNHVSLFGFEEGYAFMRLIIEKFRKKY